MEFKDLLITLTIFLTVHLTIVATKPTTEAAFDEVENVEAVFIGGEFDEEYENLRDLQKRHVESLLKHPDVVAVDINHKTIGGERTDQLSLVIWVDKKLPEEEVPHERRLPRDIEGFQTDVIEAPGRAEFMQFVPTDDSAINYTTVIPPEDCPCRDPLTNLRGGQCLFMKGINCYGTLGYFARRRAPYRDIGILSNYHVTGARDTILHSWPIRFGAPHDDYVATVDVDRIDKFVDASYSPLCRDPPPPFQLKDAAGTKVLGIQRKPPPECGDRVRFCGCRSGCTGFGHIHSMDWCGYVKYNKTGEVRRFCNQILFTPPSMSGDSGSLLINDQNRAVGLVFAGIEGIYGIANHIQTVLTALGVELAV